MSDLDTIPTDETTRSGEQKTCPACDGPVTSEEVTQEFPYGVRTETIHLTAKVIVSSCKACNFGWTGWVGEVARHNAVCAHLGVLSPQEITQGRSKHGLTQVAASELTGIGVASIKRWESGVVIQNRSSDQLLRVLFSDEGPKLLKSLKRVF